MAKRRGQGAPAGRDGKAGNASGPRQAGSREVPANAPAVAAKASAAAAEAAALQPIDPMDPAAEALLRARSAMARGDLRAVRTWAKEALPIAGSDQTRVEAGRLLADAGADPAALFASFVVFAVIAGAAWFALIHRH